MQIVKNTTILFEPGLIQRMWDRGEYEKSLFVMNRLCLVGILGLEPRMTGPESVVLPLHHIPICFSLNNG